MMISAYEISYPNPQIWEALSDINYPVKNELH